MLTKSFVCPLHGSTTTVFVPSVNFTGCAVVPVGSTRTGFDAVPISVPDALRRFMWSARDAVIRAAAPLPEESVESPSLKTPPTLVSVVVPAVNAELSVNPAEAVHPTAQLSTKSSIPAISTTLAPERAAPPKFANVDVKRIRSEVEANSTSIPT